MIIDCETCVMRDLACGDCVVSFLAEASPEAAELSDAETRAVAVLAGSGLVPPLRMAGDPATRTASGGDVPCPSRPFGQGGASHPALLLPARPALLGRGAA